MEFKKRNLFGSIGIYLRGIAMGAVDVVPEFLEEQLPLFRVFMKSY